MLQPITITFQGADTVIRCKQAAVWPPHWAKFGTAEQLRGRLSLEEYERAKVWQSTCGLMAMAPETCVKCPLALRESSGKPLVPSRPDPAPVTIQRPKGRSGGR